ncbi:MAG: hypothetical protein ACOCU8_01580 [Patescibacteria group bacterium]
MEIIDNIIANIINPLMMLAIAVGVVYFVFGVVLFIWGSDNAEKRQTGSQHIIYGLIGLFIALSAFGIMWSICATFGFSCS